MSDFDAVFDFLEDDGLTIPRVKSKAHPEGRDYVIPSPDVETGIRLTALGEIANKVNQGVEVSPRDIKRLHFDDEQEHEFAEQVLGPVYQQMIDDGVSWVRVQKITQYAFTHFAFGADAAKHAAAEGIFSGKARARNRQERRAQARRTGAAQ